MPSHHRMARGTALVEALIAVLVLGFGTLGVMRMQTAWSADAAVARQRTQALRFAQRELETLRAFASAGAASGVLTFVDIASSASVIDAAVDASAEASYAIVRTVTPLADGRSKAVDVAARWIDRSGAAQQVALQSVIARADPAESGALQIGSRSPAVRGAGARSPSIPVLAKDLGNGRSAVKLASDASSVLLLDNRNGTVIARCAVDPTVSSDDLVVGSLGPCDAIGAHLLAGIVRFAPDRWDLSQTPNGDPLPLAIELALTAGPYDEPPTCAAEPMKVVSFTVRGVASTRAVPMAALPATVAATTWVETGDRFVAYRCSVVPRRDGAWSGRSTLVPSGWSIGTGAADRRVCRYIADTDRSGRVDHNIEHPDAYADVTGALIQQNFLVVRGSDACPNQPDGGDPHATALTTAAHQP